MHVLRPLLLTFSCLVGISTFAHADTIQYQVLFTPGAGFAGPGGSGTFSVDTSSGNVTAADFKLDGYEATLDGTGIYGTPTALADGSELNFEGTTDGDFWSYQVLLSVYEDAGVEQYILGVPELTVLDRGTVGLTPALTASPEPSSVLLFGTGLAGMATVVFRRRIA